MIELDGEIHNSKESKIMDDNRTLVLNELKLNVVRFTNEEVINKIDDVMKTIEQVANNFKLNC